MTPLLSDSRQTNSKRTREEQFFDTECAEGTAVTKREGQKKENNKKPCTGDLEPKTEDLEPKTESGSIVIALLADGKGDGKAVAGRGERAGGKGSVGARRILQAIEIEDQLARFVESVGGETGVKKAASAVGSRRAGGVAKNEEEFGHGGIFEDGLEAECFSGESEFSGAWDRLIVIGADECSESDDLGRGIGDPFGGDAVSCVWRIPFQPVKTSDGRRMRIFDAESKAILAADDVQIQGADCQMWRHLVLVSFGVKWLRLRRCAGNEKVFREATIGGIQGHGFAFKMKNGEMRGPRCEVNLVVPCRANGIVAVLEPFEAGERKPAVGLQEVRGVFGTPGDQVFLPGGILGERRRGKISAGKDCEHRCGERSPGTHTEV